MDKSWMYLDDRWSKEYQTGMDNFLKMAKQNRGPNRKVRCPCRTCRNVPPYLSLSLVRKHLEDKGMDLTYTEWKFHGERTWVANDGRGGMGRSEEASNQQHHEEDDHDDLQELLQDLQRGNFIGDEDVLGNGDEDELGKFHELFRVAKQKLYTNCKYSVLLFVVKLLRLKVINRWSNKSFTMALELFKDALPVDNLLPPSYYEARKLLSSIGLVSERIHACKNDCVLFRKEIEELDICPECNESRWKVNDGKGKQVPHKVLRYFPIKPRLQRLYMSRKIAMQMRWHKEKRVEEVGSLSHPADGEAWKDFDEKHPSFAVDPRSIRLGLSSDGFNPFNNMSTSYSMWPVVLVNYNMPPWESRKDSNFMLSLLIPGPRSPGKDIDTYLQPLIDDLVDLWQGVRTYDAGKNEYFNLCAAVLWTISDFPALGDLSGWVTKGKLACPCCNDETSYVSLRSKIGYLGHRRFLPTGHRWRKCPAKFNGKHEHELAPREISGNEILEQLQAVQHVKLGKNLSVKKRKRPMEERNWSKKSIFFTLPYWKDLMMPHNLDVMHIEKNWLESLLGTILNIAGKTKDTDKARLDLADMGIRKELHLQPKNGKFEKPAACYTLTQAEKNGFLQFLKDVKYPDCFAASISRCVNIKNGKISGLKTHDCHVLLQRMLPIGLRGYLNREVLNVLCDVAKFFQSLCCRKLKTEDIDKLQENIVFTLCKLEMIFPPAFFDIMIHLAIHLPRQAKLGGPVQNRWMYPFERYLGSLKGTVKNRAHPEGSIAETYIVNESLSFCSTYLDDSESSISRRDRYYDGENDGNDHLSVFAHRTRPFGSPTGDTLAREQLDIIHWYVLNNCDELQPFLIEHEEILRSAGHEDVIGLQKKYFPSWLAEKVKLLQNDRSSRVREELYSLVKGPDKRVTRFSGCIVNGVKYLAASRDSRRKTQNSGVRVEGEDNNKKVNFYGVVEEVIKLTYRGNIEVVVFLCEWFDGRYMKEDMYFTSINMKRKWYANEPYVLASQVSQVFYVQDTRLGADWRVVQIVDHRHLWNPALIQSKPDEESHEDLGDNEATVYQQFDNLNDILNVDDNDVQMLHRNDIEPEVVSIARDEEGKTNEGFINDESEVSSFTDDSDEGSFSGSE